jgi:hypothetical protein
LLLRRPQDFSPDGAGAEAAVFRDKRGGTYAGVVWSTAHRRSDREHRRWVQGISILLSDRLAVDLETFKAFRVGETASYEGAIAWFGEVAKLGEARSEPKEVELPPAQKRQPRPLHFLTEYEGKPVQTLWEMEDWLHDSMESLFPHRYRQLYTDMLRGQSTIAVQDGILLLQVCNPASCERTVVVVAAVLETGQWHAGVVRKEKIERVSKHDTKPPPQLERALLAKQRALR